MKRYKTLKPDKLNVTHIFEKWCKQKLIRFYLLVLFVTYLCFQMRNLMALLQTLSTLSMFIFFNTMSSNTKYFLKHRHNNIDINSKVKLLLVLTTFPKEVLIKLTHQFTKFNYVNMITLNKLTLDLNNMDFNCFELIHDFNQQMAYEFNPERSCIVGSPKCDKFN